MSPTQRTLRYLRERDWIAAVVERWNHHARIRQDLFGAFDVVALPPGGPITGVQVKSRTGAAEAERKLRDSEAVTRWMQCGGAVQVISWRKVKVKRGGKAMRWEPRIVIVEAAA